MYHKSKDIGDVMGSIAENKKRKKTLKMILLYIDTKQAVVMRNNSININTKEKSKTKKRKRA